MRMSVSAGSPIERYIYLKNVLWKNEYLGGGNRTHLDHIDHASLNRMQIQFSKATTELLFNYLKILAPMQIQFTD